MGTRTPYPFVDLFPSTSGVFNLTLKLVDLDLEGLYGLLRGKGVVVLVEVVVEMVFHGLELNYRPS